MIIHKEKTFLLQPGVLVMIAILFLISSLAGISVLAFLFALVLSLSAISFLYLRYFQNKVFWSFKKYFESSSIDETVKVFIEVKNESAFPLYNLELNVESRSENDIVFVFQEDGGRESTMFTILLDLPPKSQKMIEVAIRGKNRGNHRWSSFALQLRDPLKLQTYRLDYSKERLPGFMVVPRILKLNDLKLKSLLQGYKNTNHSLFMDETSIIGTKEYENESFRHIHWLATAKENKLLSKKYQKVHGDLYSLYLNIVGNGPFHLRRDMEELIEYTVSVCLHLIKEGCKIELWVNYSTESKGILRLENDVDRSQLKKMIGALALIDTNGVFLSTKQFYQNGLTQKDDKSLALVIGTPPEPTKLHHWLHIKQ